MKMMKVLRSPPDTYFVIASDLTAGQSKVGDLFRQSQNVLSFFFGRVKNVNQLLWWTPRCKPSPDYQCFQAFQVFKFLHRLSMFSSWTVDNLSGFLSYRHDQTEPVDPETLNRLFCLMTMSCEMGSGWLVVTLKYKIRQCLISGYHLGDLEYCAIH